MQWTAGLLNLLLPVLGPAEGQAPTPGPMASLIAPLPAPRSQDWFGAPVLPEVFRSVDPPDDEPPPLLQDPAGRPEGPAPAARREDPADPERSWGRGLTARDLQAWQEEDDLRIIREWAGDALLGVPLLLPQLVLEGVLPRGVKVGPATFLYRTSPASSSLVVVVLDQMLFHEAQYLSRVREVADDRYEPPDFSRGERRVVRRSVMMGMRATYVMPGLTMDAVLQAAADQGPAGWLLVPPLGAALLFLKGIDQKFDLENEVHVRFRLASGRDWLHAAQCNNGVPTLSLELKFGKLPVGLVGSYDLSSRGMTTSFIGIGTTLDAVEEVLGREASRSWRPE